MDGETICEHCSREFVYNRKSGHSKTICNSCRVTKARNKRNERIYEYKGNSCEKCGYNRSKKALCFHHIKPEDKLFAIANSWSKSWDRVRNELDKCILLCANCHAEMHDKNIGL